VLDSLRQILVVRHRWLGFVLPMAVFLILTSLEPKPTPAGEEAAAGLSIPYDSYPAAYVLKIALVVSAMILVAPIYRSIPLGVSPWAIVVGVVGVFLWVGICSLGLEARYLPTWLVGGTRSAFNPLAEMADRPALAYGFLAVRLFGLACVVPVIEEFFLRGFLTRYLSDDHWEQVPFGRAAWFPTAMTIAAAAMMHPGELLAALAWFSLVTNLYGRTGNLWDAVAAHAVTNLLLGVYVIGSGAWHFL